MMEKYYRLIRGSAAVLVFLAVIAAFAGLGYPLKIFDGQLLPLIGRAAIEFSVGAAVWLALLTGITLVGGRLYCSVLCPLGLLQEAVGLLHRGKKCLIIRNRSYKYGLAAAVIGMLAGGSAWLAAHTVTVNATRTIFYGIVGGAFGIGVWIVLFGLVWFKKRWFCANLCPAGAILGLLGKRAALKIYVDADRCVGCGLCARHCPTGSIDFANKCVDNETCVKCFACLAVCPQKCLHYGKAPQTQTQPFFSASRRQFLANGAAVLVLLAAGVRGGFELAKITAQKVKKRLLPAGAQNVAAFVDRCLNCNLCVANCNENH